MNQHANYPLPALGQRQNVVFVASESPDYQHAGHNVWIKDVIKFLNGRAFAVTVIVVSSRLGFFIRRRSCFPYQLASPILREWGPYYVVVSPKAVLTDLLWNVFMRLPQRMQNWASGLRSMVRRGKGFDFRLGNHNSKAENRFVRRKVEELRPRAAFFNTLFTDVDLVGAGEVKKMILVHDLISERVISLRKSGYRTMPAEFSTEEEAERLRSFDSIIAIQWDEGEKIRSMVPGANVIVVPVVMPLVERLQEGAPETCMFVGSGSLPNVDGLDWFTKEVWPLVISERPAAVLNVYGSVCSRMTHRGKNVVLHGVLDSLDRAYNESQVAIVPLRAGSGLKVKLIESLTHCMPTVTTSVGAQGLDHLEPRPFIVADEPKTMARRILDLFGSRELRTDLSVAAREASMLFQPETAYAPLVEALDFNRHGSRGLPHQRSDFQHRPT